MRLALFQPDIPQNAATMIRACACLGVTIDLIEPCGFALSDQRFRRAGLDYVDRSDLKRHASWEAFRAAVAERAVLITPSASSRYTEFRFAASDVLVLGRESVGFPDWVHESIPHQVCIPMRSGLRSINVALAGAMVLGEALRQTASFPA